MNTMNWWSVLYIAIGYFIHVDCAYVNDLESLNPVTWFLMIIWYGEKCTDLKEINLTDIATCNHVFKSIYELTLLWKR